MASSKCNNNMVQSLLHGRGRGRLFLSILLALAVSTTANAQAFLDKLRKIESGRGIVIVQQNRDIDRLVNNYQEPTPAAPAHTSVSPAHNTPGYPAHSTETTRPEATAPHSTTTPSAGTDSEADMTTVIDTRKKVMRNSYKTTGYRIQLYSGGNSRADRQKAERIGNEIKAYFPYEPIYVHFYSPSWKCRMGNYKEIEDARAILKQVKELGYKQACIVKGTISVAY